MMTTIVRGELYHTPRSPFEHPDALQCFADGGVAFDEHGRILATGPYGEVRRRHPAADVSALPGAIVLPGLIDTHVHFPQLAIIGAMGLELLDWLAQRTLPEEARLADAQLAYSAAHAFLAQLAANGTTTALVFGCHFPAAQEAFFEEAHASRLRITSGLVVSDRKLRAELHTTPEAAYEASAELIGRWHGRGRLRYAVTPRFSLSCSEPMLESCRGVLEVGDGVFLTSHLNESPLEVRTVAELFPWARDYLETYERFGLVGERSVFAHNVQATDDELRRLAAAGARIAHCPSSNQFLGSGLFPLRRHLEHGVHVALGSDVGAGTSLSMLSEAQFAYLHQMLREDGRRLAPAELLYLATLAGAEALALSGQVGDLSPGKSADLVVIAPPTDSTLAQVLARATEAEARLSAVITLAREESVREVRVAGAVVGGGPALSHARRRH